MAGIFAIHAAHQRLTSETSDYSRKNSDNYAQMSDSVDMLDDNSIENDANLKDSDEQDQTRLMNLINLGYNNTQLLERQTDIRVFHISKTKQIARAFRLFFKICCCILYVLQTELKAPDDNLPGYCKALDRLIDFKILPSLNPAFNIFEQEPIEQNCPGKYYYQLDGYRPHDQLPEHHLLKNNKTLNLYKDAYAIKYDIKTYDCSSVCNMNKTCSDVTQNNFYTFCSCIIDCGGRLICKSEHEMNFHEDVGFPMYDYSKLIFYPKSLHLYVIQAIFSLIVMFESIVTCILFFKNGVRWFKLIDTYVIIDIVIGILFIITLIYPPCLKNLFIPIFLQCLSARIILNEIIFEIDTYSSQTKWMNAVTQKMISLLFTIGAVLFVSVCLMHYLERTHADSKIPNLFESLWFTIITITTVGYGDIYPVTWYGKVYTMCLVILVLFSLTTVLDELLDLFGSSHRTTAAYFNYAKHKHVVIITSNVRMNFLVDFLSELYAEEDDDLTTVILCPRSPDKMTENRLRSPLWRRRVVFLQGSALRTVDLNRASITNAKYCFLTPDRHTEDPNATDQEIILRAIAIKRFAPRVKLYVHILKPENRFHVDFANKIMCEGEIKHALFASNCICPGFSSFMTLLLHTTSPDPTEKNQEYSYCSGNEIYDIRLEDSRLFSQYAGKNFLFTAVLVLRTSGVLLIGVKRSENNKIFLNPGLHYILKSNDTCFYISQNREELSKVVEREPKYEVKDELEKICAQVSLVNMHYYNMDNDLKKPNHDDFEENPSLFEDKNTDDATAKKNQSMRDGYMMMQAVAESKVHNVHYKFKDQPSEKIEEEIVSKPPMLSTLDKLESCSIPLGSPTCPVADSVFETPLPVDMRSMHLLNLPDCSELDFSESTENETKSQIPEKHHLENVRPIHSYSSSSYPRRKMSHHKRTVTEVGTPVGLSKLLRPQGGDAKNRPSCSEGPVKKKILHLGKMKTRFSRKNIFDPTETPLEGNLTIRDEEEQKELHQLEDNTNAFEIKSNPLEAITGKHGVGVPPVRPYIGSSKIHCHVNLQPVRQCCLQFGWKIHCHDSKIFKSTREQFRPEDPCVRHLYPFPYSNAIIISADDAGPQLYHLILPLRSQYIPPKEVIPVVLLIPVIPEPNFLEAISWLPLVFFMVGTAESVDDLLIAGVLNAKGVILCVGDGVHEEKDEDHMTDASRLNVVLKMRKVFPNTPFYVELFHRSNMRFLSYKGAGVSSFRKNPDFFLTTPYFKSGHVFSPSMLDTIIYQSAKKDYIIELVRLMLGLEQREGSAYLAKVEISEYEASHLKNYGRMMQKLAYDRKDLAIGIYRTEIQKPPTRNDTLQYSKIQEFLQYKLNEFRMDKVEIPPLPTSTNSYVLVNPDISLALHPNDIILVLRCNNIKTVTSKELRTIKLMPTISIPPEMSDSDSDSEIETRKSALKKLKSSFIFKSKDDQPPKQRHSTSTSESFRKDPALPEIQIPTRTFSDATQRRKLFGSLKSCNLLRSKGSLDPASAPKQYLDIQFDDSTKHLSLRRSLDAPMIKSHSHEPLTNLSSFEKLK